MYYTHTPYNYNTGASHLEIFRTRIATMSAKNLATVTAGNLATVARFEQDTTHQGDAEWERLAKDAAQRLAACNAETARRAK